MTLAVERGKFPFEPFARQPEYVKVNRDFVREVLPVIPGATILDIACGTGLVTGAIRDKYNGIPSTIIGVDPNPASLEAARKNVPSIGNTSVKFQEGFGQNINLTPGSVDAIFICNAIHEIPGNETKQAVIQRAAELLGPGRLLAVNSAFTTESYPEDAMKLWGMLKLYAIQAVSGKRMKDMPGFEVLPKDTYKKMMEEAGLAVTVLPPRRVDISIDAMRAISGYDTFIQGTFMDVVKKDTGEAISLEEGSAGLNAAITRLEEEHKKRNGQDAQLTFGRNWIEFVARKPLKANLNFN